MDAMELIISVTAVLLILVWYIEPRIFLFLTNALFFSLQKGRALHIDKRKYFPESVQLESNWQIIAAELSKITTNDIPKLHHVDKVHFRISFDTGPAWRTVILKAYDGWFKDNCEKFPQTCEFLKNLHTVETVMISILEPHANIPPHTGKFSGVFRYHLGLSIPQNGDCHLVVNGEKYYWKDGEGVLFDDTYVHSVENDTDEYRAVLLLDIKKPSPSFSKPLYKLVLSVIRNSPIFNKAVRNGKINLA